MENSVLHFEIAHVVRDALQGLTLVLCLCLSGCGSGQNALKLPDDASKTIKVSGVVTVDGKPGWGVFVTLNAKPGTVAGSLSEGEGNEEGKFEISTYIAADGAPPGEYTLTFRRVDKTIFHIGGDGPPDLFKGAYSKPAESKHSVSIQEGSEPVDLGVIELTSPGN